MGVAMLRSMAEYEVRRSEENKKKEAKFWIMKRGDITHSHRRSHMRGGGDSAYLTQAVQ